MKTCIRNLFLLLALVAGVGLNPPGQVRAQTFSSLYSFTALDSNFANNDGAYPAAGLLLSGNALYGTASQGGADGGGTVFKINADGTGFATLHSFEVLDPTTGANSGGAYPLGGLILSGNSLYGTTSGGGTPGNGAVFKLNTDGTGFTNLYTFTASDPNTGSNGDGSAPWAGLILSSNTLYGTASRGGTFGSGTVFKLNTDGTGFKNLYSFTALDANNLTNADGAFPLGGLVSSGSTLYGTAYRGGNLGSGTVFRVNIDGTGFANLHDANGGPRAGLILSGSTLYGTTEGVGSSVEGGAVFKVNTDGTGFTNLQTFAADEPWSGLVLSSNRLYGTTLLGGSSGQGTVYQLNTDGTGFTNLYNFTGGADGAQPQAGLTLTNGFLYGTTSEGGSAGFGAIFRLSLETISAAQLTIVRSGGNVILSWPINAGGFTLQSATNLVPLAAWITVTPPPTVINGQNVVTNPISTLQKFYRLSQ